MKNALRRLFYIMTGIYPENATATYTAGTGTLSGYFVTLGYDQIQSEISVNKMPLIILDESGERLERTAQGAFSHVYRVRLEVIVSIPKHGASLIGRGSDIGVLDAFDVLQTLLTLEANTRLTVGGTLYTDSLVFPVSTESGTIVNDAGLAFARSRQCVAEYTRLAFIEE